MFIGWRYMHHRYINWQMAFIKQIGNIAEEHRNKIGPAFIHRFAHTVTHEHTVDIEDAFILWLINSNIALHGNKYQFHLFQPVRLFGQFT